MLGYSGLPIGLQLIGRPLDEANIYQFAEAFERERLFPKLKYEINGFESFRESQRDVVIFPGKSIVLPRLPLTTRFLNKSDSPVLSFFVLDCHFSGLGLMP
jgi:hypothetical protein